MCWALHTEHHACRFGCQQTLPRNKALVLLLCIRVLFQSNYIHVSDAGAMVFGFWAIAWGAASAETPPQYWEDSSYKSCAAEIMVITFSWRSASDKRGAPLAIFLGGTNAARGTRVAYWATRKESVPLKSCHVRPLKRVYLISDHRGTSSAYREGMSQYQTQRSLSLKWDL